MERVRIFNEYNLKELFQDLTNLRIKNLTTQELNLGVCGAFKNFNGLDYFPDKRITDREILGEFNVLYVVDDKIVKMDLENEYLPPSAFGPPSKEIASKRIIFSRQEEYWRNIDILYGIFLDYSRKNIDAITERVLEIRKKEQREKENGKIRKSLFSHLERLESKVNGK